MQFFLDYTAALLHVLKNHEFLKACAVQGFFVSLISKLDLRM